MKNLTTICLCMSEIATKISSSIPHSCGTREVKNNCKSDLCMSSFIANCAYETCNKKNLTTVSFCISEIATKISSSILHSCATSEKEPNLGENTQPNTSSIGKIQILHALIFFLGANLCMLRSFFLKEGCA